MKRIAIDLGSGITKIYMPGCGVVLTEATCVAVEQYEEEGEKKLEIKAYGDKARALSGRAALNTRIINPIFEGDIVYPDIAAHLLSYFLDKVELTPRQAKHAEAIFTFPCGISTEIQAKYRQLAEDCGLENSYFTPSPFAAVAGHNVAISESTPMFSLDIGHSITNIAVFSRDGIISGLNVNLGGGNVDEHLIEDFAQNSDFKIGALTAEKLKITVGSMLEDDNKSSVVNGREISTGQPASLFVNSEKIQPILTAYINKIIEYVQLVISKLPPEVASAIMHGGVYLSGGLMKLDGMPEYIGNKLSIPVNITEEPQLAPVIGAGAILSDDELLNLLTAD